MMAALPKIPPHVDAATIAAALAGGSALIAMTQRLAAALAVIAQPVTPPPGGPNVHDALSGLDAVKHYREQAEVKAAHAAQVLAEVQSAAAAVSQSAAAGLALVPHGPGA